MYRVIDRRGSDGKPTAEEIMDRLLLDVFIDAIFKRPPGFYVQRLSPEKRAILANLKSDDVYDVTPLMVKVQSPLRIK